MEGNSKEWRAGKTLLISRPNCHRGTMFTGLRWDSKAVEENILELCRWNEQRSDGGLGTNYGRVLWTNRIWVCALGSAPLRAKWWSVQSPTDTSPCRQNPDSNNTIIQMLLISHPSVIPHLDHFSWSPRQTPANISLPFFSSFSPRSTLCVASHADGVELLMECWAGKISLAAVLGLCCF